MVGIGTIITPFLLIHTFFTNDYFSGASWAGIELLNINHGLFKFWILFEMVSNLFLFCMSLLIIFLFFKQRDTLPRTIIAFFAFSVTQLLVELIFGYQFPELYKNDELSQSAQDLAKTAVKALIWIPYFIKSTRVAETFIYPYKEARPLTETPIIPIKTEEDLF